MPFKKKAHCALCIRLILTKAVVSLVIAYIFMTLCLVLLTFSFS